METTANRNTAILMQISTFTQYFIPLGNYIFPTLIWSIKRNESKFVDYNGKQLINFQLSLLIYYLILLLIAVPVILYTIFNDTNLQLSIQSEGDWVIDQLTNTSITGIILVAVVSIGLIALLKIAEFFLIIYGAVKNSNGENYKYPLTINFIK